MVHLVYCDDKEKVLEKILTDNQENLNLSKNQQKRWHKKCYMPPLTTTVIIGKFDLTSCL